LKKVTRPLLNISLFAILLVFIIIVIRAIIPTDFEFKGKYPPVKIISIEDNGQKYDIEGIEGQVIVLFQSTVKHSQAVKIIKENKGRIVSQRVKFRHYLVDVGSGNEASFIRNMRRYEIHFSFLNMVFYPCENTPQTHVMDNFYITHGDTVSYVLEECGLSTKVIRHNAGVENDEKGRYSSSEIINYLLKILSNAPKNTPVVINMSFGPKFIDENIYRWTDEDITPNVKEYYKLHYKESIKELMMYASFFKDKDFVIVKAAGNEGLKKLDTEILNDLSNELRKKSENHFKILNEHFILAGAIDTRDSEYSNTVTEGKYHSLYTAVDISELELNGKILDGTSHAAPRLSCFISNAINENKIKASEALQAVKSITQRNPNQALTQDSLNIEAKKIAEANKNKSKEITDKQTKSKTTAETKKSSKQTNNNYNETAQSVNRKSNSIEDFEWSKFLSISRKPGIIITGYKGTSKQVIIPDKIDNLDVVIIDNKAFRGKNLSSVTIPNTVFAIGDNAFDNNRLTSINLPNSLEDIGDKAFFGNSLTSIFIPETVSHIGVSAFAVNKLTTVKFEGGLISIGKTAFGLNKITHVELPNAAMYGDDLFLGNELTSVTIGSDYFFINEYMIDRGFFLAYSYENKKTAGTYTRSDSKSTDWRKAR
jgi:hypothetical protein